MIKAAIAGLAASDADKLCYALDKLPFSIAVKERICAKKNRRDVAASALAYLLLYKLLRDAEHIGPGELLPELVQDGKKPSFKCENKESPLPVFNISHSGSICAVIISDEGEVGIDVQDCPENRATLGRALSRFTRGREQTLDSLLSGAECAKNFLEKAFFNLSICGEDPSEWLSPVSGELYGIEETKDRELTRWTMLEAYLKALGCGFSGKAATEDPPFRDAYDSLSFAINYKNTEYSVSAVRIKNKKR